VYETSPPVPLIAPGIPVNFPSAVYNTIPNVDPSSLSFPDGYDWLTAGNEGIGAADEIYFTSGGNSYALWLSNFWMDSPTSYMPSSGNAFVPCSWIGAPTYLASYPAWTQTYLQAYANDMYAWLAANPMLPGIYVPAVLMPE